MKSPERRVLRQLVEAVLFEGLVSFSTTAVRAGVSFRFVLGAQEYECEGQVGAFGRVRVNAASIRRCGARDAGDTVGEVGWEELARSLPAQPTVLPALLEELGNTVRFCELNHAERARAVAPRRDQPHDALEALIDEGHPYHPCFKARAGFSVDDHRRYGPEARGSFQLVWLAVRRQHLRQSLPEDETVFWRRELGDDTWLQLLGALAREGASAAEYGLLPVHPWQWSRLAQRELAPSLSTRSVLGLGVLGDFYAATQSVRTLVNVTHPERAQLKLPLAVRITSALRLLEPESVVAAPALSAWLKALVASDAFYATEHGLTLLGEYAGACFEPPEHGGAELLGGQLAAIWREPLAGHLGEGEAAVPFNALTLTETDARPFIADWLALHGLERWVRRLVDVCVLPLWHLLSRHGVAVEAHAQNMILVHRQGWPERLALRDFHDSVEYVPEYLADPSRVPAFGEIHPAYVGAPANRYYAMSSVEELRELFMDSVFVYNLSDLSFLLQARYGLAERRFWSHVQGCLAAHLRSRWGDPERAARLNHEAQWVRTESLFARRLEGGRSARWHHLVDNPLFASGS